MLITLCVVVGTTAAAQSVAYSYDSLNRLIGVAYPDGTTIVYSYDAAGNRLTMNVSAGCAFSLSTTSVNFPPDGGSGSVGVTTAAGCPWTAASNAAFLTVTSGAGGTGNGTVTYSVASGIAGRTGTLVVGGQILTVIQAAAVAPAVPGTPSPVSAATNVSTTPTLTWTSAGATTYDVRFGTSNPPPPASAGQLTAAYAPSKLAYNTTYFWQVVAHNSTDARTGPVWSFTTAVASTTAEMLTPTPGTTFSTSTAIFTWTAGPDVSQIWLDIGSSAGGAQYYGETQRTGTARTVTGLPADGSRVHVRLWSLGNSAGAGWAFNDYTYTAASPALLYAANGATLPGSSVLFTWTPPTDNISQFWLDVGTTPGGGDIHSATQARRTSRTVAGIPTNGAPVYARFWWLAYGAWHSTDYTFNANTAAVANMTRPVIGGTLPDSTVTFSWTTPSPAASQVWLDVGTTLGGSDIYGATQGRETSRTVRELPTTGAPLYARLWTLAAGAWQYIDYPFKQNSGAIASVTSPVYGATLSGTSVTFTWAGGGGSPVWLDVGTTPGGAQIHSASAGLTASHGVSGLPTSGATIYMRLWTLTGGAWEFIDYAYTTAVGAAMISPTPGSLHGRSVTFTWAVGIGSQIWLDVGTTPGGSEIYAATQGTGTLRTVTGLPANGSTLYVRLWSIVGGAWTYTDYIYITAP